MSTTNHEDLWDTIYDSCNEWAVSNLKSKRSTKFPKKLYKEFCKLGFPAGIYESKYGGSDLDFVNSLPWITALAESDPGVAIGFSVSTGLGCKMLLEGSEEQKNNYLIPILKGEKVSAFGLTEPGAGSDVANIKTTAKKTPTGWLLNGQKIFITNGTQADVVLVAAKTTPSKKHKGISIFVVETNNPNLQSRQMEKNCWHTSDTAELYFDNLELPDTALIGEQDKGFYYLMENLNEGRVQFAAWNLGYARGLFKETLNYIHDREAFGSPLSDKQYIQFDMARLYSELEITQNYIKFAGKNLNQITASVAKNKAAELAETMSRQTRHWLGGYGCTPEYHVGKFASDCFVSELGEGSREVNWGIIWKNLSAAHKARSN